MAQLPSVEQLHARVATLLAVPSIISYSQALREVEEITRTACSFEHCMSPAIVPLLYYCERCKKICLASIRELAAQASAREHEMYNRSSRRSHEPKKKRRGMVESIVSALGALRLDTDPKRSGVVFDADQGEHIVAALESLRLEEFLGKDAEQVGNNGHVYFKN
ncbi:hypothetical protein F5Y09DRAFT_337814 [Xylaria sp. FL1042]|nr:hypothetical protein F5Y09DRAFT_337814 [Xylaria sp. FL1042]